MVFNYGFGNLGGIGFHYQKKLQNQSTNCGFHYGKKMQEKQD